MIDPPMAAFIDGPLDGIDAAMERQPDVVSITRDNCPADRGRIHPRTARRPLQAQAWHRPADLRLRRDGRGHRYGARAMSDSDSPDLPVRGRRLVISRNPDGKRSKRWEWSAETTYSPAEVLRQERQARVRVDEAWSHRRSDCGPRAST
jgi:hypothetical protein